MYVSLASFGLVGIEPYVVRVEVDASGMPVDVSLDKRSGSRDLDRAAMAAVKQWRFQPAQREGQAVASSLVIPIDFKPAN